MKYLPLCAFLLLCAVSLRAQHTPMDNEKMEALLKAEVELLEGERGAWQLFYGGAVVLILTDEKNNRMRIFSPIMEEEKLEEGQMKKMLEANFHSALDSKYSLHEGFVISVYTHPLAELQPEQFIDALRQVVTLAKTFGSSYHSTELIFGGSSSEEKPLPPSEDKEKRINRKPSNGR